MKTYKYYKIVGRRSFTLYRGQYRFDKLIGSWFFDKHTERPGWVKPWGRPSVRGLAPLTAKETIALVRRRPVYKGLMHELEEQLKIEEENGKK